MTASADTASPPLLLPSLAVAGTVLSWAASFPAIGYALREIEPLPLAATRFALASLLALAWLAWDRPKSMPAKDYGIVAICGVLGIAVYNVLLNSCSTRAKPLSRPGQQASSSTPSLCSWQVWQWSSSRKPSPSGVGSAP